MPRRLHACGFISFREKMAKEFFSFWFRSRRLIDALAAAKLPSREIR
jgi:hypothetical protein